MMVYSGYTEWFFRDYSGFSETMVVFYILGMAPRKSQIYKNLMDVLAGNGQRSQTKHVDRMICLAKIPKKYKNTHECTLVHVIALHVVTIARGPVYLHTNKVHEQVHGGHGE